MYFYLLAFGICFLCFTHFFITANSTYRNAVITLPWEKFAFPGMQEILLGKICVSFVYECLQVYKYTCVVQWLQRLEGGIRSSGTEVTKQLLATKPSLQCLHPTSRDYNTLNNQKYITHLNITQKSKVDKFYLVFTHSEPWKIVMIFDSLPPVLFWPPYIFLSLIVLNKRHLYSDVIGTTDIFWSLL